MTDLDVITKWGKEHGLSYGKVSEMLRTGELTYEELGLKPPAPAAKSDAEKLLEQLENGGKKKSIKPRIKPKTEREKFYYRAPYQRRKNNDQN